jgi:aspartate/methionine/tyrosine aminotransferase
MRPLNPVFADLPTTIFTAMSALAAKHGAINLGQGFPDEDGPLALREIAAKALIEGPNQYPPMLGVEALRIALAAHARDFYALEYDPAREIVVTSGATEALAASIMGLVGPGEQIVLIEPAYDSYRPIAEAIGAQVRTIRLQAPDWKLNEEMLAAAFTEKTKAIVLNSPMNPNGKVFSLDELAMIASFLERFDALAICDEVYEHLTFDGLAHTPLANLPRMRERCVRIGSAGKIFSLTGWKVGWVEGDARLVDAIAKAHQFLAFTTPGALQIAIARGLAHERAFALGLANQLQAKRNFLAGALSEIGFRTLPAHGTYFLIADFAPLGFEGGDLAFCTNLAEQSRVAAIPLSAFYSKAPPQTLVRFAFCKQREVLEGAVERLGAHLRLP